MALLPKGKENVSKNHIDQRIPMQNQIYETLSQLAMLHLEGFH